MKAGRQITISLPAFFTFKLFLIMKNIFLFLLFLATVTVNAQSDPSDPMDILDNNTKPTTTITTATFKSTRVINGQSVETIAKKHLDFRIAHRFGALNTGAYNYFGLDQATMRMSFEYGLTNDWRWAKHHTKNF
jgi:Membrane bound beta barrel domain (DUF5777)